MKATTAKDTIKTHYIDGAFVESHGQEVMDIVRPTDGQVIARVTLGDEEDTRRAIAAAKRAFVTFGRTTKEERIATLRRLHQAVSARVGDLTAAMVEEYGGVVQFASVIVESGVNAFPAAEKGLEELPLTRSWGKTTVTLEPVASWALETDWTNESKSADRSIPGSRAAFNIVRQLLSRPFSFLFISCPTRAKQTAPGDRGWKQRATAVRRP
jgi:aldehyde dehydrogenase (NAD+)